MKLAIALATVFFIVHSHGLTLGPFTNIASGVHDTWNQTDSENVRGGGFAAEYANGKLFLVSQRIYRQGFQDPWDPASRGGIVSTLDLTTKSWTHKPYGRLDEDKRGDKIFSLNGVLFLLTYSTNASKISFHNLFYWSEEKTEWSKIPITISSEATTTSTNAIQALSVQVPKQEDKVAYVVASSHGHASGGSELAFSKLEIDFRGNTPVKASLKPLTRQQNREPSAIAFSAVKNNKLIGLVQNFYSEGYVSEYQTAYALDLNTNRLSNVTLAGPAPGVDFGQEAMHQTENEILIVGGLQTYGLGRLRNVDDIFVLNLNNFQWQQKQYKIPENAGRKSALDQEGKKLYLIGLKEGVMEAVVN